MKPTPKYVGFVAKGLGVLLVQNSKDSLKMAHSNPLGLIQVNSDQINETEFLEGFQYMFNWNWKWRIKSKNKDGYLMRFPNKAKLMELANFKDFVLLGTGVVVNVQPWTLESQSVG